MEQSIMAIIKRLNMNELLLKPSTRRRIIKWIQALTKKFENTDLELLWDNMGTFTGSDSISIKCTNNPNHRRFKRKIETLCLPKCIPTCYECKYDVLLPTKGQEIGLLKVQSVDVKPGGYRITLICQCGAVQTHQASVVLNGDIQTCGSPKCRAIRREQRDWSSSIGTTFDCLKVKKVVGKSSSNNAMVSCVCALEYCHQPEDNEVIKNSNTLVNGEYNGCPCLAWVTEAKSMTRFQLDDGVFCNSTRFAYRRLAPEISGDVVPFDKFRAKVSKLNKRLNLEKNKSFIDKPTLVSLLKEPSALFELTYIIYLLKVNDKPIYAGFTTNLDRRKFEHMYAPANKDIAESIAVFGIDAHEFDIILETKNFEEASKAETNTIDKYKLFTEGCNANRGQASNPLSYFKTLKQINDVYGFFTNFESSDSYPPKKQAAEECQISLQDLTRTFQCLVRWNALLPYRVVGRHISELSEEEVKAVKNAVKQRKAVPGIAKEYNVEHECVKRLRDTVFKDNLSKSGSIMRTNSDDKRFIANCLEYGFSLRKTISIAKSLGIDCPSHKSLSKSLKEYTSIFTKRKSNQILDDINNVLASSDIQPVALNFVIPKKAGRCGYGQQAILTKIVSNFCLSGIPRPFINDGVTFTTEQIRAAIAYVKTGNELALMDGIDSRIDYGQLRTQLLNLKKELGTFGFVLSDDVKSFIKECIKNKISYTQISKKVKERFGVTYCRKVIARNEDSFLLFQAAVKS